MSGGSLDDGAAVPACGRNSDELLMLLYNELRRLASARLAKETPGQTLQPTALVHEAYLRLVKAGDPCWENEGHFFAAAAEAMRRILVDNARRKQSVRHGGGYDRLDLDHIDLGELSADQDLLAVEEALRELERHDAQAAALVKLRFFGGLSHVQAADALGVSRRTADRKWTIARAWLQARLTDSD